MILSVPMFLHAVPDPGDNLAEDSNSVEVGAMEPSPNKVEKCLTTTEPTHSL